MRTAGVGGTVTGDEDEAEAAGAESALQPATTNTTKANTELARRMFKRTS